MTDSTLPLDFDQPAFLATAALAPLFWSWGRRRLSVLGKRRAWTIVALRSIVWLLLVAACAEMQWVRTDDKLTVIYLLDRSHSISEAHRRAMIDFVNRSISAGRRADDRAGVITFGREARTESPPIADELRLPDTLATVVDPQYTNLEEAVKLAEASFPEDSAKRIVVVSDGNENLGDVYDETRRAAAQGIAVDVVPIVDPAAGDVLVEKVSLPAMARRGEPFEVQVLLNNAPPGGTRGTVGGTLEILRRRGDDVAIVGRERVVLPPGKRPFAFRQTLEEPDFYTFEAKFTPDDPSANAQPRNDRAVNFVQVEGSGRVLFMENCQRSGEHARIVEALRREKIDVVTTPSNRPFQSPAELIPYDAVVLADVPRSAGDSVEELVDFTDAQVKMLLDNVHEMGCGLVMLGGPNSFGAGGWAGSALEEAMPVDFQIKNLKVVPSGALMLVLDSSGSMAGEKLDITKSAAMASLRALGGKDFAGVVSFDSDARWIVPLKPMTSPGDVASQLRRLRAGGGTNMMPALEQAYAAVQTAPAAVKHVIVLSDGRTEGRGYEDLAASLRREGVTTTCVAVGQGAAVELLEGIARAGGGKFYRTDHLNVIPRIFVSEAKRIARPLVYEAPQGFSVRNVAPQHEVLRNVRRPPPPLTGFVMTSAKRHALVQVLLDHPQFATEGTGTIAAAWTYGLGRTAVWTTDCGQAWANRWNDWPEFDGLLTGLIRWTMRPATTGGRFAVHAEASDGLGRIVVTAVDESGDYLNLLTPQGAVIGPDLKSRPIRVEQVAPGRYAATFPADGVGSYFIVIRPGPDRPTLRTGLNVSYSAEFRDRGSDLSLLRSLAELKSARGPTGIMTPPLASSPDSASATSRTLGSSPPIDFFRHDLPRAAAHRDLWPELVLAALVLFAADVVLRRAAFDLRSLLMLPATYLARHRSRTAVAGSRYIERLRTRKSEVVDEVRRQRSTAAVEPSSSAIEAEASFGGKRAVSESSLPPAASQPDDFTSRLLDAKRKDREKREVRSRLPDV